MAQLLTLDALYPEMEEATIGQWLVATGDHVTAEQPIAELITDKVAYEYRSPDTGTILAIFAPAKSVIPVGTTLAAVGMPGEAIPDREAIVTHNRRLAAEHEARLSAVQAAAGTQIASMATPATSAVRATPAARRLARERGIDLASLQGSGPGGMITVDDIPTG